MNATNLIGIRTRLSDFTFQSANRYTTDILDKFLLDISLTLKMERLPDMNSVILMKYFERFEIIYLLPSRCGGGLVCHRSMQDPSHLGRGRTVSTLRDVPQRSQSKWQPTHFSVTERFFLETGISKNTPLLICWRREKANCNHDVSYMKQKLIPMSWAFFFLLAWNIVEFWRNFPLRCGYFLP